MELFPYKVYYWIYIQWSFRETGTMGTLSSLLSPLLMSPPLSSLPLPLEVGPKYS